MFYMYTDQYIVHTRVHFKLVCIHVHVYAMHTGPYCMLVHAQGINIFAEWFCPSTQYKNTLTPSKSLERDAAYMYSVTAVCSYNVVVDEICSTGRYSHVAVSFQYSPATGAQILN